MCLYFIIFTSCGVISIKKKTNSRRIQRNEKKKEKGTRILVDYCEVASNEMVNLNELAK